MMILQISLNWIYAFESLYCPNLVTVALSPKGSHIVLQKLRNFSYNGETSNDLQVHLNLIGVSYWSCYRSYKMFSKPLDLNVMMSSTSFYQSCRQNVVTTTLNEKGLSRFIKVTWPYIVVIIISLVERNL